MAKDGEDFLSKIDEVQPRLVTLDVMMPGLTTKEILEHFKKKKIVNQKFIFLTVVRFSEEEKQHIFKIRNVIEYIYKTFELDDLVNIIKKTCAVVINYN